MDNEVFDYVTFAKIAIADVTKDQNRWLYFIKERGKVKILINVEGVDG